MLAPERTVWRRLLRGAYRVVFPPFLVAGRLEGQLSLPLSPAAVVSVVVEAASDANQRRAFRRKVQVQSKRSSVTLTFAPDRWKRDAGHPLLAVRVSTHQAGSLVAWQAEHPMWYLAMYGAFMLFMLTAPFWRPGGAQALSGQLDVAFAFVVLAGCYWLHAHEVVHLRRLVLQALDTAASH